MSRIVLAAAVIAVTMSLPAHAGISNNGISLNGISLNGISLNGISLNGSAVRWFTSADLGGTIDSSTPVRVELPR